MYYVSTYARTIGAIYVQLFSLEVPLEGWLRGIYVVCRECISTGARTRRSLGHHLLHPLILRLLVLCATADFEAQSSLL